MAYTTIDDPSAYFQTDLYTGTGSSLANTFDGNSDMQPDLVWIKKRNSGESHAVCDSTRGTSATLFSDNDAVESTSSEVVKAYNSDGFTVGTEGIVNDSSDTYVAWAWKANGGSTTSATTTDGIDSATRQVDSTSKFSIIAYTSESSQAVGTIEHGLGVAPEVMIIKRRPQTDNWLVYHHKNTAAPETDVLQLNITDATVDHTGPWNDTAPTSSVFTLGTISNSNEGSGVTYICYAWAGVQGYSKFGSYQGNGVVGNGPFVYTGFKPAWIMLKPTDAAIDWFIYDNRRAAGNTVEARYNEVKSVLYANANSAGSGTAYRGVDLVSNGFNIFNGGAGGLNQSGVNYVYMAFAEEPLVTSDGVPATAR